MLSQKNDETRRGAIVSATIIRQCVCVVIVVFVCLSAKRVLRRICPRASATLPAPSSNQIGSVRTYRRARNVFIVRLRLRLTKVVSAVCVAPYERASRAPKILNSWERRFDCIRTESKFQTERSALKLPSLFRDNSERYVVRIRVRNTMLVYAFLIPTLSIQMYTFSDRAILHLYIYVCACVRINTFRVVPNPRRVCRRREVTTNFSRK